MMDLKNLKSLISLMADNGLTELELQDAKGEKVILRRGPVGGGAVQYVTAAPAVAAMPGAAVGGGQAVAASGGGNGGGASGGASGGDAEAVLPKITSPMVGTFYASPSPDAKPFVTVGSKVTAETVVCIIEAMKVFNEIKAETSGTVVKVLAASGKAVEFGQPLFVIQPG